MGGCGVVLLLGSQVEGFVFEVADGDQCESARLREQVAFGEQVGQRFWQ